MAEVNGRKLDYDFGNPDDPNVERNDDWIRQLPSAKAEREMIARLSKEHAAWEARVAEATRLAAMLPVTAEFDPDQPRDELGRWAGGGGAAEGDSPEACEKAVDARRAWAKEHL